MYTALYRKWRPKAFSDVIGQDHITTTLKNEIKTNRLSHAYLFIGSRGTGKTTCARILAKAVNCPHVHEGEPCNECEICRGIDNGTVLDITEIDAASNNGVENIRELREEVNFNPTETKYRVYIIDEVHMLSPGAFNALLKTLEEPPAHVKFILATTEAHKMPATILSRCQRFDFKRIGADVMGERLLYIAEKEGISLTAEAANLISRLSDGAMRDALSILDQCISRSHDIDTKLVGEVCGIADREYLRETAEALLAKDSERILAIVARLYENACDMEIFCAELINYYRNILVARTVKNPEKLIVCSDDELEGICTFAERITLPAAISVMNALQGAYASIKSGAQGRTAMEMVLIKLASPEMDSRDESILKRLAALESAVRAGVPAAKEADSAPVQEHPPVSGEKIAAARGEEIAVSVEPSASAQATEASDQPEPEASQPTSAAVRELRQWPEILQALFPENRLAWTILNGTTAKQAGTTIIVFGSHPSIPDILAMKINEDDVLRVAQQVTGESFHRVMAQADAGALLGEGAVPAPNPLEQLLQKANEHNIPIEYND